MENSNEKPYENTSTIEMQGEELSGLLSKIPFDKAPLDSEKEEDKKEEDNKDNKEEEGSQEKEKEQEKKKEENKEEDKEEEKNNKQDKNDLDYTSLFEGLVKSSDIELDEELELEPNEKGLSDLTKVIMSKVSSKAKKQALKEIEEKYPELNSLFEHLETGYSISSFQKEIDLKSFKDLELDENDSDTNEKVYRAYLNSKNIEGEEQDEMVENAKDTDRLYNKATDAKAKLVLLEEKELKITKDQELDNVKKVKEAREKTDTEIKRNLSKGDLLGYKLSKEDVSFLQKSIYEVGNDGVTAREKAWNSLTTEQIMLLDHIVLNNFSPLGLQTNNNKKFITIKGQADKEKNKQKPDLDSNSGGGSSKIKIKSIKDFGIEG